MGYILGYERLKFHECNEIFAQLQEIDGSVPTVPTEPFPKMMKLWFYSDNGIQRNRKDGFGAELRYTRSGDFYKKLKWPKKLAMQNKAIKAYLRALPKNTMIILYWD